MLAGAQPRHHHLLTAARPARASRRSRIGSTAVFDVVGLPQALLHPISYRAGRLAFITVLHVLIGEMVAEEPGDRRAGSGSRLWLVPVHVAWVKLANPFIWFLNLVANSLLAGGEGRAEGRAGDGLHLRRARRGC